MKYLKALIFLLISIPLSANAAWNITVERNRLSPAYATNAIVEFVFTCESDASASGDQSLRTLLQAAYPNDHNGYMRDIAGGLFWLLKYKPGSATPTSVTTIKVDDETYLSSGVSGILFDEAVTAAGVSEPFSGDIETGSLIPIKELYFSMTTLGDSKTATLRIWILKLN